MSILVDFGMDSSSTVVGLQKIVGVKITVLIEEGKQAQKFVQVDALEILFNIL